MARQPKKISEFDVRLGAVIRGARNKRKMTQAALAKAVGIPLSNLQRREEGLNEITASELTRLALALGEDRADLVEQALKDYGGIEKLIEEHAPVSEIPVSLTEHRRKKKPSEMTDEELEGFEGNVAANTDPEHLEDEPEHP